MSDIVYDIPDTHETSSRHTLAVVVDNEFGVLARVIGLFSGRGYNIESLTVAEVEHSRHLSRITIVTSGSEMVIEQIKRLLERMVPVYQVNDLTVEGPHIEGELALITLSGAREDIEKATAKYNTRILSDSSGSLVLELTGTSKQVDACLRQLKPLGILEMARSGVVAIAQIKSKSTD